MAVIETLEGMVGPALRYHYDVTDDVLYVRLASYEAADALGEETDDGMILLRDATSDKPIGLTVVNWWKRFGQGDLPDSIREIQGRIESLASRLAA
jgi:hypothetical protein